MSCLLCQTLQGKVYEMYESSSYLRLCLGMQGGRGMEVTPLALTSTSVADQFPVGRQLHQAQPCICSSHNICHIVIPRTSTRSCVILRAHPHSQLSLTVSSASHSIRPHSIPSSKTHPHMCKLMSLIFVCIFWSLPCSLPCFCIVGQCISSDSVSSTQQYIESEEHAASKRFAWSESGT